MESQQENSILKNLSDESQREALNEELRTLRAELEDSKKNSFKRDVIEIEEKLNEQLAVNEALSREMDEVSSDLMEKSDNCFRLEQELASCKLKMQSMKDLLDKMQTESKVNNDKDDDLKTKLQESTVELSNLLACNQKLSLELSSKEVELNKAKMISEDLSKELSSKNEIISSFTEKINSLNATNFDLKSSKNELEIEMNSKLGAEKAEKDILQVCVIIIRNFILG